MLRGLRDSTFTNKSLNNVSLEKIFIDSFLNRSARASTVFDYLKRGVGSSNGLFYFFYRVFCRVLSVSSLTINLKIDFRIFDRLAYSGSRGSRCIQSFKSFLNGLYHR